MAKNQNNVVMLKRAWPSNFRRSVHNKKREVVEVLEFTPGVPVELSDEQRAAVDGDVGKCLVEVDDKLLAKLSSRPRRSEAGEGEPGASEPGAGKPGECERCVEGEKELLDARKKIKTLIEQKSDLEKALADADEQIESLVQAMNAPAGDEQGDGDDKDPAAAKEAQANEPEAQETQAKGDAADLPAGGGEKPPAKGKGKRKR